MCEIVRVEIRDHNEKSWCFFRMSTVPRVGDRLVVFENVDIDSEGEELVEGRVIDVRWLLLKSDFRGDRDASDCVVVTVRKDAF